MRNTFDRTEGRGAGPAGEDVVDCPSCGASNPDSATFCALCLRPVAASRQPTESVFVTAKALPLDIQDEVLLAATKVVGLFRKCELDSSKAALLLAPDLVEVLQHSISQGREADDLTGLPEREFAGLSFKVEGFYRTESGEAVVVEAVPGDTQRDGTAGPEAVEQWWFTRRARQGTCAVCAGPLPADPMSTSCGYCGAGLERGDWMLVKVIRGGWSMGAGATNQSLGITRGSTVSPDVMRPARERRVAAAFLRALVTNEAEGLKQLVAAGAYDRVQDVIAGADDIRAAIHEAGGPEAMAVRITSGRDIVSGMTSHVSLIRSYGVRMPSADASEDLSQTVGALPPGLREAAEAALAGRSESRQFRVAGWRWTWSRVSAARCPVCGGSVPEAAAPDACEYCGNWVGVGEWLVASCLPGGSGDDGFGPVRTVQSSIVTWESLR